MKIYLTQEEMFTDEVRFIHVTFADFLPHSLTAVTTEVCSFRSEILFIVTLNKMTDLLEIEHYWIHLGYKYTTQRYI